MLAAVIFVQMFQCNIMENYHSDKAANILYYYLVPWDFK